jgi:hypothetical protein
VTIAGWPAWTLAPEDAIIQLAAHLAVGHQMAAPGLRGLLDVALLARSQPVDWQAVAGRAHAWRVEAATWLVLDLADALFGLPGAGAAIAGLRLHRIRRGLLGCFVDADAMLAGRDLTHGPLRFVYQLLLVDHIRDAARLLTRALWPEDEWLAARYGRKDVRTRCRHLLGAVQGKI